MKKDTSYPAFPTRSQNEDPARPDISGITQRDYFAAKAMQALISNPNVKRPHPEDGDLESQYDSFSSIAYEYADAMLKQKQL